MLKKNKTTREEWLTTLAIELKNDFRAAGHPLPNTVRVSCGITSSGRSKKNSTIGLCYASGASDDNTHEIFISPELSDDVQVASVLIHELCHAALPWKVGHGPAFKKLATALGLEGKMTATVPSKAGVKMIKERIKTAKIGRYPHAKMNLKSGPRQSTRMLKVECKDCGMILRTSVKWIDQVLEMDCPCGGHLRG